MKKALLTLGLVGTFAGTAYAQTSVTVYGVVDQALAYEKNGGAPGSVLRLDSGWLSGSRIGFKGTEDLGGGLSAFFQIENGFSADNGALGNGGLLFGRQSLVGIKGGFGTVSAGRQYLPMYTNSARFDPFGDALGGDSFNLFNYSGSRVNNSVSYVYDANGFRGQLITGLGEVAGNSRAGRTLAGSGSYTNGPVDVVLMYTGVTDANGRVTGKTTLLGGNYNFGVVKVFATYTWNKDVTQTNVITSGASSGAALLGFNAPIGQAGTFEASYIRFSDKTNNNANANQIAIGYLYAVSKRTTLYTSLSRLANDSNASYKTGTLAGSPGGTDKLFLAGVKHAF